MNVDYGVPLLTGPAGSGLQEGGTSTVIVFIVGSGWVRGQAARRYVRCRHVYAATQPARVEDICPYKAEPHVCVYIDTTDSGDSSTHSVFLRFSFRLLSTRSFLRKLVPRTLPSCARRLSTRRPHSAWATGHM